MVTYSHVSECCGPFCLLLLQTYTKGYFVCVRFFILPNSMFSLNVFLVLRLGLVNVNMSASFYFIYCSMTIFFLGRVHLQWHCSPHPSSSVTFLIATMVSKIGFKFLCHASFSILQCFVDPHWCNLS